MSVKNRQFKQWMMKFIFNLKCPYHQNFYFPIWSYISCIEHLRKKFAIWIKSDFVMTWKSYFLAVDPCRWSQHPHAQSCDVDSGTCDFRLDLSRLFYLFKFNLLVHAKCSFPACCMNYKVKLRGKTSEITQAWGHVFLNLRHNSFKKKGRLVRMAD